jgi:predicted phosphodiesterase
MTSNRTILGDITLELISRFPDVSQRQLSRMLYRDNPSVFLDLEAARTAVRYYTGTIGAKNRSRATTTHLFRDPERGQALQCNPFGLPQPDNDNWKPVKLPVTKGRGILLYDIHLPFHDLHALTLSLKWSTKNKFNDFIILPGDLLDCYQLSKFNKDPRQRDFISELDMLKKFFEVLRKKFPHAVIIWKHGNHESRLERYFQCKAPELFGLKDFIWNKYLELDKYDVQLIEADIPIYVGKLNIIHGHEMPGSYSVVNPARGAYLKAMECIIEGHFHRTSHHNEKSFSDRLDSAWSVGCLCNLHPPYLRNNKWNSGFAAMEVDGKDFTIRNWRIVEGDMVR